MFELFVCVSVCVRVRRLLEAALYLIVYMQPNSSLPGIEKGLIAIYRTDINVLLFKETLKKAKFM